MTLYKEERFNRESVLDKKKTPSNQQRHSSTRSTQHVTHWEQNALLKAEHYDSSGKTLQKNFSKHNWQREVEVKFEGCKLHRPSSNREKQAIESCPL